MSENWGHGQGCQDRLGAGGAALHPERRARATVTCGQEHAARAHPPQGTVELLGFATEENTTRLPFPMPSFIFHFTYVSHTLEPIHPVSGPAILPQATYKDLLTEKKQFDIIFVPGG